VAHSYDRSTTKNQREEAVPVATELVPFLELAMDTSPSELVFPKPDGSMMREDVNTELVLRRALGRAGIVLGYEHVCRRKNCGHKATAADGELRRCPCCNMKLWPKALVRPIRSTICVTRWRACSSWRARTRLPCSASFATAIRV
jgi:hypothetical protein